MFRADGGVGGYGYGEFWGGCSHLPQAQPDPVPAGMSSALPQPTAAAHPAYRSRGRSHGPQTSLLLLYPHSAPAVQHLPLLLPRPQLQPLSLTVGASFCAPSSCPFPHRLTSRMPFSMLTGSISESDWYQPIWLVKNQPSVSGQKFSTSAPLVEIIFPFA